LIWNGLAVRQPLPKRAAKVLISGCKYKQLVYRDSCESARE
jgi:hypothetical protein